jgi:DNA-binding NtrC family response regulator
MERPNNKSAENGPMALLVLSCPERQARLAAILRGIGVESLWVRRCWEARELLQTQPLLDTVVTDATLEDANWCDVLRAVVDYDPQASVVVVAPSSADEILWSEVMWRGVHDMLVEPFTKIEAQRVLEGALRAGGQKATAAVA